jgi:3-dehydroquinate synthase
MPLVNLALGERSYDIHVGPNLLAFAGATMRPLLPQPRVFVVTDSTVAGQHLPALEASLEQAGIGYTVEVLPPGEATKDFAHLEGLLDAMQEADCERGTTVVAFGGGVIGDLAGFAASIFLRGVPFIQIPTTLLAQVDSSVGGKTAIDTRWGKNMVGSFYQPRLVLADIDLLATLPERQLRAGYAEIVKYGLIDDADFFSWLETHGAALLAGDAAARGEAVYRSCLSKARIVAEDEREGGRRALLNLGHTFAHALETEAGFGDLLLHGEAVSIGLVLAFALSVRRGLCPPGDLARLRRHLSATGMPVRPPPLPGKTWDPARLVAHMSSDKKVRDGRIAFVVAGGIGRAMLSRDIPASEAAAVLGEMFATELR